MRRIAISDIHGCHKTFQYLIQEKIQLTTEDRLYILGDYIDRGPGSRQVIDLIMQLRNEGHKVRCLLGNHELMMMNSRYSQRESRRWMINGGAETMDSFGMYSLKDIPEPYWTFLESLETSIILDDYVLVHAGLNFDKANPLDDQDSCVWIRKWYDNIDKEWLGKRIILHGHTPIVDKDIEARVAAQDFEEKPYMDIDAGCCYPLKGMGHLCAFDMDKKTVFLQPRLEII